MKLRIFIYIMCAVMVGLWGYGKWREHHPKFERPEDWKNLPQVEFKQLDCNPMPLGPKIIGTFTWPQSARDCNEEDIKRQAPEFYYRNHPPVTVYSSSNRGVLFPR
jgi:hypothetical protein